MCILCIATFQITVDEITYSTSLVGYWYYDDPSEHFPTLTEEAHLKEPTLGLCILYEHFLMFLRKIVYYI